MQYIIFILSNSHWIGFEYSTDLANLWVRTLQQSWACQTAYSLLISDWNYSIRPNNDVKSERRNAANCQICSGIITQYGRMIGKEPFRLENDEKVLLQIISLNYFNVRNESTSPHHEKFNKNGKLNDP